MRATPEDETTSPQKEEEQYLKPEGNEEEREEKKKLQVPDGGWGWMVVLGCWIMHFLLGGYSRSFAVTYVAIREKFQSTAAITSWIGGINVGLRFFLGPLATALSSHFGVRPVVFCGGLLMGIFSILSAWAPNEYFLFFSYSIGTAFGGCLIYAPALILVNQYFDKRRSLAVGIASAGSGFGVFLFPPLMDLLFSHYGFSGALIILGAVCFNNCIAGALYRPLHKKAPPTKKTVPRRSTHTSLLCTVAQWINKHFGLYNLTKFVFAFYCLAMTFITLSYVAGHQLLVDLARERGIPESKAVFMLSVVGITDTLGRLGSGFIFDLPWFKSRRKILYGVSVVGAGAFLTAIGFCSDYAVLLVCCAFQGFFNGVVVCQRAVVIVDIVGLENLSSCFGLCVACQGVGVMLGPMVAGLLKDIFLSYTPSYIFVGISCFLGGLFVFISVLRHEVNLKNKGTKSDTIVREIA